MIRSDEPERDNGEIFAFAGILEDIISKVPLRQREQELLHFTQEMKQGRLKSKMIRDSSAKSGVLSRGLFGAPRPIQGCYEGSIFPLIEHFTENIGNQNKGESIIFNGKSGGWGYPEPRCGGKSVGVKLLMVLY